MIKKKSTTSVNFLKNKQKLNQKKSIKKNVTAKIIPLHLSTMNKLNKKKQKSYKHMRS